ncbi:MAG: FAD-dependent oxidoreductase [Syntrophomonadaceae bacterium]|nr:FAD-dependent oxidoreductase [Syntrophomonadaceae bacterium]
MGNYPHLFSKLQIGDITLKNRVVMGPMLVGYADQTGRVNENVIKYYEARAKGGAGLIIVEACCVDVPTGKEGAGQIHIDNADCIPGLTSLARTIKKYDCKAFVQLFHAGRQTSSQITGVPPVAPTRKGLTPSREVPRELSYSEIKNLINQFIKAADYAYQAGFDGVELHAAHGYLLNEFLSPKMNTRQDEYGGSLQNRMRILLEIIAGIKLQHPSLAISVRLNIDDFIPGGLQPEQSVLIAQELEKHGANLINCSCGTYESGLTSIEPASYPEGWRVYLAEKVKQRVQIPVVTGGMIYNPDFADKVIAEGRADLIFLGRSLLADPKWPIKAQRGKCEDIRPCIRCNGCINLHFAGMPVSCTVNPSTGRETQYRTRLARIPVASKVDIIGAGPAGIQAALTLDAMGFDVNLFEKDSHPGGLLKYAAKPPHKERINDYHRFLVNCLKRSGVKQIYNYPYQLTDLQSRRPDHLIIATGSRPHIPDLPGIEHCLNLEDILGERISVNGSEVVIIGGGSNGCEVADFLLQFNNRITILEERTRVAADMERKNRRDLLNRLEAGGVTLLVKHKVLEITENGVITVDSAQNRKTIPAQQVILATGYKPINHLYHQARRLMPSVHVIGDALRVRGFKSAILEGHMTAYMIYREQLKQKQRGQGS